MRTANRLRTPSRTTLGLALAGVTVALLTSACSLQDAVCGGGEYPVLHVGSAGSACVSDDEEPPKGYARYPEGKVPERVDDKWYTYWSTRTLDENGNTIELPDEN
ncbi:SCO0607 family lipoprotein [Streptomyces sp. NPDC005794]|uniref:SCO0607 family lipoprotein n=1 Tax=Streptomyces sp. NPDC005794 TaxID=3364733 RepID=UPI0036A6D021